MSKKTEVQLREERIRRNIEREANPSVIYQMWMIIKIIVLGALLIAFVIIAAMHIWEHGLPTASPEAYWR